MSDELTPRRRQILEFIQDAIAANGLPPTRAEIADLVFAAVGRTPRYRRVSRRAIGALGKLLRPFHPRMGHLSEFFGAASVHDFVAPRRGARRLAEYLRARAEDLELAAGSSARLPE